MFRLKIEKFFENFNGFFYFLQKRIDRKPFFFFILICHMLFVGFCGEFLTSDSGPILFSEKHRLNYIEEGPLVFFVFFSPVIAGFTVLLLNRCLWSRESWFFIVSGFYLLLFSFILVFFFIVFLVKIYFFVGFWIIYEYLKIYCLKLSGLLFVSLILGIGLSDKYPQSFLVHFNFGHWWFNIILFFLISTRYLLGIYGGYLEYLAYLALEADKFFIMSPDLLTKLTEELIAEIREDALKEVEAAAKLNAWEKLLAFLGLKK